MLEMLEDRLTPSSISGVSPNSGSVAGGGTVYIYGSGLSGATLVTFGGVSAPTFMVESATEIMAEAPAHAAGVVDTVVTAPSGVSPITSADQYTYQAPSAPTVTSVSPNSGSTAGGAYVTIDGSGFVSGSSSVSFGGVAGNMVYVVNSGVIDAYAPAHAAGTVDVTVTTGGGTSSTSSADQFTYNAPPTPAVASVSPNSGSTAGGTYVTIDGSGFVSGSSSVSFGGVAGNMVYVVNSGVIDAYAPAHAAGTVDVTVTTGGGTSSTSSADQFTYNAPPTPAVASVSPNSGSTAGGAYVTIDGSGFVSGSSSVSFGGVAGNMVYVVNSGVIDAYAPAHAAGTVDVTVTTGGGTSAVVTADQYTYSAPQVAALQIAVSAPSSATAGTQITYAITVGNTGTAAAAAVTLTDTVPSGASFVSQSQASGPAFTLSESGATVGDTIASLAPGASAVIDVVVLVAAADANNSTLYNSASAAASNASTAYAYAPTTVYRPSLQVALSAPSSVAAGGQVAYAITLTNAGQGAALNAALADALPAGETLVSQSQASGPAFTPSANGNTINDTIASLAPGATAVFDVVALAAASEPNYAVLADTATLSAANGSPASASASTVVYTPAPDLTRQVETIQYDQVPLAEAGVNVGTGGVVLTQPLDFAQSDAARSQLSFALTYDSALTDATLAVEAVVVAPSSASRMPTAVTATLTINGVAVQTEGFSTLYWQPGQTYLLDVQAAVPAVGLLSWQLSYQLTLPGGGVVQETQSGSSASAYGSGWGLSGVDQLIPPAARQTGVEWVSGDGDYRYFVGGPNDGSAETFVSPAGDFGVLTMNADGTFTYTAHDGVKEQFNALGLETALVEPAGPGWTFSYDSLDRLVSVTAGDGGVTTLAYAGGELSSVAEPGTRTLTFTHDGSGNLTGLVDAAGDPRTFAYASPLNANLLTQDVWAPYDTTFTYGPTTGKLTGVSLGSAQTYTVASGTVTDGDGDGTAYAVNGYGQLTSEYRPGGLDQSWGYVNGAGLLSSYTDADGHGTSYTYDNSGDPLTTIDGDGNATTDTYDSLGDVLTEQVRDYGGTVVLVTTNTYDVAGEPLSTTVGSGSSAVTTTYTWSNGLMTSMTDGAGNVTYYTYDALRQLVAQATYDNADVLKDGEAFTYDANGFLLTATVGAGGPSPETTRTVNDGDGRVLSTTDPLGYTTSGAYDAAGFVTSTTDARGFATTFAFNAAALVIQSVADANTSAPETTQDVYDPAGNLTKTTDPVGDVTINAYNGDDELIKATQYDVSGVPVGSDAYTYDGDGDVLTATDGAGDVTGETYDDNGDLLTTMVYGSSGTAGQDGATYDALGDVLTVTDGDGNTTTDAYNTSGQMLTGQGKSAGGVLVLSGSYGYDKGGNETTATDGVGTVSATTYDGGAATESKTTAADGAVISDNKDAYNLVGDATSSTDGAGNVTGYVDNADGETTAEQVTGSGGASVESDSSTYDGGGNVLTSTDGNGNVTTNTYNADNLVLTSVVRDPQGNLISSQTNTYDLDGNQLTSKDGDGNLTTNSYDGGRLMETRVTDPSGAVVSDLKYTYDQAGRVATTTDGDGNVTTNTYDAAGRVLSTTLRDAGGNLVGSTTNTYDLAGNLLTTTDGDGNRTTNTYDGAGRVLTTTLTDGSGKVITSTTNTYDLAGDLLTSTDAAGDVTRNTYEGGRLLTTTVGYGTASAALTSYTYDLNSNVASETDPDGNVTSYTTDALGDVVSTVTPLGTTTARYDQAGNKVWQQDADGRVTTYAYDGGRLTTETQYNADGSVNNVLTWTYDANGNVLTATDNAGTVTMTYDGNRLLTRTDPFGLTITYGYDEAGNVISESDSLGGLTTYTYDGGRMTSLTYQDASGVQLTTAFTYDADGNVLTTARYAVVSGTAQLAAQTNDAYDGGLATSIVTTDPSGNVIQSDSYTYDVAARLSSQTDNGVTTPYSYDATSQLTVDGGTGYTYDANGNRTLPGYVTGTDNELLSDGTWNYTYDAEGNTVQKVNIATGETWTYGYDDNNRMVSAVDRQADGTLIQSATYEYDALGNCIQEAVTTGGVTTVTNYAFDAAGNIWADLNGGNNDALETRWLFLQGADEVFARIGEAGGATAGVAWYLTDHLGSVQDIVNNAGVVLDQRTYDAFGAITSETNAALGDRYGFQGGQEDPVTGFGYFLNRYLRSAGDWTTEDPDGLTEGTNRFRFVGNDPTDATDPTGLSEVLTRQKLENGDIRLYREDDGTLWVSEQVAEVVTGPVGWTVAYFRLMAAADKAATHTEYIGYLPSGGGSTVWRDGVSTNVDVSLVEANIGDASITDWGAWLQKKANDPNAPFRDPSSAAGLASGSDPGFSRFVGENSGVKPGDANGVGSGTMQSRMQAVINAGNEAAHNSLRDHLILAGGVAMGGVVAGLTANGQTVIKETMSGSGNITSKVSLTEDEALEAGEAFLGPGYKEIGKANSGVFRSADGLRQFRIDNNSLLGNHAPGAPHVHFETYGPGAATPTVNNHVPLQ